MLRQVDGMIKGGSISLTTWGVGGGEGGQQAWLGLDSSTPGTGGVNVEAAAPSPFISFPSGLGLVGPVFTEAAGREGQAGALDKEAAWLAPATVIAHAAPPPAPPTSTSPAPAPPLPASVAQRPSPLSKPQFPSLNSGGRDNPAGGVVGEEVSRK